MPKLNGIRVEWKAGWMYCTYPGYQCLLVCSSYVMSAAKASVWMGMRGSGCIGGIGWMVLFFAGTSDNPGQVELTATTQSGREREAFILPTICFDINPHTALTGPIPRSISGNKMGNWNFCTLSAKRFMWNVDTGSKPKSYGFSCFNRVLRTQKLSTHKWPSNPDWTLLAEIYLVLV